MDIPGNRGGMGERRETETKGAARNGKRMVDVEVGEGGSGGLAYEDGDACLSRILCEGGEEVEVDKDGAQDKAKRFFGTMNFLEKHDVNGEKEFVKVTNF